MSYANLTPMEFKIVQFVERVLSRSGGRYPTQSEIQKNFKLKSSNSTRQYFMSLAEKNVLELTGRGKYKLISQTENGLRRIPLSGQVAAGLLTEAIEESEYIDLPTSMLSDGKDYFGLKVVGDSMIEEHIIEGDTVILERTSGFSNGDIVVALSNGHATLKKIFKEKDHIRLVAANPSYAPIIVKNDPSFRVLGKLKSVLRLN